MFHFIFLLYCVRVVRVLDDRERGKISEKYIKTITEHPPQKSTIHRQLQSSTDMQKNRESGIVSPLGLHARHV
jgi:hypothetical protein